MIEIKEIFQEDKPDETIDNPKRVIKNDKRFKYLHDKKKEQDKYIHQLQNRVIEITEEIKLLRSNHLAHIQSDINSIKKKMGI